MATTGKALLVHLRDPSAVAKANSGFGALASMLVPKTVEDEVYSAMAGEFGSSLRARNIEADVSVVESTAGLIPASAATDGSSFVKGLAVGAGACGLVLLLYKVIQGR
jgi:hypothetical protein